MSRTKEGNAKYYRKHKRHHKELMQKWYAKHSTYFQQYYLKNKKSIDKMIKAWRAKNPEKVSIYVARMEEKCRFGRIMYKYIKQMTSVPVGEEIVLGNAVYRRMK